MQQICLHGNRRCHPCSTVASCIQIHIQHAAVNPAGSEGEPQTSYIIPPNTAIHTAIMADANKHSCSLQVTTSNDTVIRGVMLFAEQVNYAALTKLASRTPL